MRKLYRYIKESFILRTNVYIYHQGIEEGRKRARVEVYTRLNERLDALIGGSELLINQGPQWDKYYAPVAPAVAEAVGHPEWPSTVGGLKT